MTTLEEVEDRVAKLRKGPRLERLLPESPAADDSPWDPWLYVVRYVALVAALIGFWASNPGAGVALAGSAVLLFGIEKRTKPTDARVREKLLKRGIVTRGAIVQAHGDWFDDGNRDPYPGSVVITFDAELAEDAAALHELGSRIAALKHQDRTRMSRELAAVAWTLYHEIPHVERVPVPEDFAGVPDVWLCSATLPAGAPHDGRTVWVLALPDDAHAEATAVLPAAAVPG